MLLQEPANAFADGMTLELRKRISEGRGKFEFTSDICSYNK